LNKLDLRGDEGILVGYSCTRKSYKFYNLRLNKIVEVTDVKVDESYLLNPKKNKIDYHIFENRDQDELSETKNQPESINYQTPSKLINQTPSTPTRIESPSSFKTPSKRVQKTILQIRSSDI